MARRQATTSRPGEGDQSSADDSTRRTEILRTAELLIASSGLRTSLQEIADAAGILPGSLYHHFESKEALLVELVLRYHADLDRIAVETADAGSPTLRYSWRDLDRATAMMANLLQSLDIPDGSRVAVQVEKSVEAMVLYLATLRAGYVFLPLNTAYQKGEIEYFVGNAEPEVVVCTPGSTQCASTTARRVCLPNATGYAVTECPGAASATSACANGARPPRSSSSTRRAEEASVTLTRSSTTTARPAS